MVDFKRKIRELMNVSYGLNEEKPITNRSIIRKDHHIDSLSNMNETDFMSKSSSHFIRNKSKPSVISGFTNSFSNLVSSQKGSNHNMLDDNHFNIKKTPNHSELIIKTGIPETRNRKHEFFQIKYSDLLGKKEENSKRNKNNKFMDLLLNEETFQKTTSYSTGFQFSSNDQKKSHQTTNKFMKQFEDFAQSLMNNYNNKRIALNKPAISVKSTIDTQKFLAFSPTAKKSLAHTSRIIKTTHDEKYTSLLFNHDMNSHIMTSGHHTSKLFMSSNIF